MIRGSARNRLTQRGWSMRNKQGSVGILDQLIYLMIPADQEIDCNGCAFRGPFNWARISGLESALYGILSTHDMRGCRRPLPGSSGL